MTEKRCVPSVVLELNKGGHPENLLVVFRPNKGLFFLFFFSFLFFFLTFYVFRSHGWCSLQRHNNDDDVNDVPYYL